MFQRIKGAFDSIAEEQARQRVVQQTSSGRGTSTTRSSSQSHRSARPRKPYDYQDTHSSANKEQDPDPESFASGFVVGEDDAAGSLTSQDQPNQPLERDDPNDNKDENVTHNFAGSEQGANSTTMNQPTELPIDVRNKLRKLDKLETKYQELLKAYRKAHARNSAIEPFEARLRESTPLTTINDPSALVEYLNQLNVKGGMVMQELRKASQEKDELKKKLQEAEQKTMHAFDELAQIRRLPNVNAESTSTLEHKTKRDNLVLEFQSNHAADLAASSPTVAVENEDFFSIDSEMPRLQALLTTREQRIETLEIDVEQCKRNLSTAEESAERMISDLEHKQHTIETLTSSNDDHAIKADALTRRCETSDAAVTEAMNELEAVEEQLQTMAARIRHSEHAGNGAEPVEEPQKALISDDTQNTTTGPMEIDVLREAKEELGAPSKRRKNKKKKKPSQQLRESFQDATHDKFELSSATTGHSELEKRLETCLEQLRLKDVMLADIRRDRSDREEAAEEIETLRDELLSIGQEHVEAKEKIKMLEAEISGIGDAGEEFGATGDTQELKQQMQHLEEALLAARAREGELQEIVSTVKADLLASEDAIAKSKQAAIIELRDQSQRLGVELFAAQELATTRYKEITQLKSVLQSCRTELGDARSKLGELKTLKNELVEKSLKLGELESKEVSLESSMSFLKQRLSEREVDSKNLSEKLRQENARRLELEESSRKTNRDMQRSQNERAEAVSSRTEALKKLTESESLGKEARAQLSEVQSQLVSLQRDASGLREEISLKTAQHASAQSLMGSVRDQATEMATQLKEARTRCESLEDELSDAQRLMSERGREGETMRRLLSEVESRANARVKELRERMEVAVQERDRAEEEASVAGRRKGREMDELKNRTRDAEKNLKQALEEKTEVERLERELRKRSEEDIRRREQMTQEASEVRKAMSELRDALDEGERQARELEVEKSDVKRALDDLQGRFDKAQKSSKAVAEEVRSLKATRIRPMDSGAQSSRSSAESNRAARMTLATSNGNDAPKTNIATTGLGSGAGVDFVYLKNILLQFLEQKDKKHQRQLVPVLGMLLHFDQRDEQKWMAAITTK